MSRESFQTGSTRVRFTLLAVSLFTLSAVAAVEAPPDKLVVLTFDDSVASHYTVARPLLKRYGFGATFFITEGFGFLTNKKDYMTWEQIAELHRDGFEIGNHTVLQFHGVPEGEHPWVHTSRERFEEYMALLHRERYTVIALRDLAKYVDEAHPPADPMAVIRARQAHASQSRP